MQLFRRRERQPDCTPDFSGKKCNKCKETFNFSYLSQLYSEYRILSDYDRNRSQHASGVIDEIIKRVESKGNVTCDDIFNFEKALSQLKPLQAVKQELGNLREKYKMLVGDSNYVKYLRNASRDTSDELIIRGDVDYLLSELHLLYAILPSREQLKAHLMAVSATITVPIIITLGTLYFISNGGGFYLFFIAMAFGAAGGFLSMVRKVQDMPHNFDVTISFLELKYGKFSVMLAPLTGSAFAAVLLLLFATGMISGTLFPTLNESARPMFFGDIRLSAVEFGKLAVWSFLAGFAERLVPDTLDKILAEKVSGEKLKVLEMT